MKPLGNRWRILAHPLAGSERITDTDRNHDPSEFDEIVVGNDREVWFHMEQMNERDWWFAFYIDRDRRVSGNMRVFHTKPNELTVWTDASGEPEDRFTYPGDT